MCNRQVKDEQLQGLGVLPIYGFLFGFTAMFAVSFFLTNY